MTRACWGLTLGSWGGARTLRWGGGCVESRGWGGGAGGRCKGYAMGGCLSNGRGEEGLSGGTLTYVFSRVWRSAEEGKGHEQVVYNVFVNKTRDWKGIMVRLVTSRGRNATLFNNGRPPAHPLFFFFFFFFFFFDFSESSLLLLWFACLRCCG
jgi:hypothetical protein